VLVPMGRVRVTLIWSSAREVGARFMPMPANWWREKAVTLKASARMRSRLWRHTPMARS